MKILVTGGSGFIGSNLVRLLIKEKGAQVINVDKLTYAGNPESLSDLADDPNYTSEQIDLAIPGSQDSAPAVSASVPTASRKSLQAIFAEHQPDAVIHLAAESHVDRSIDGPGEFIQSNIVATFNLLQASLQYWRSLPETDSGSEIQDPSIPVSRNPHHVSQRNA